MDSLTTAQIYENVKDRYLSFVLTTIARNNTSLYNELKETFSSNELLWRDLILQIAPEYRVENAETITTVGFEPAFADYLKRTFSSPFSHQVNAWDIINKGKNCTLATGTGSGKTEAFLFPVLNYCLKNEHNGVQAIIIYPLKALAKDQGERIGEWLDKINESFGTNIKYGIFDGDTGKRAASGAKSEINDKEALVKNPPNILITNYVMLERILLNPKYINVLSNSEVKYVILDEIHYYRGAQGIDVSLLMRRLQFHLAQVQDLSLQYIGTSATLGSPKSKLVKDFLNKLFNAVFEEESIVFPVFSENYTQNSLSVPRFLSELDFDNEISGIDKSIKTHSFFCSPPPIYRCMSCKQLHTKKVDECTSCSSKLVFEIVTCRQCGSEYFTYGFTLPEMYQDYDVSFETLDIIGSLDHFDAHNYTEKTGEIILSSKKNKSTDSELKICGECLNIHMGSELKCLNCGGETHSFFAPVNPEKNSVIFNNECNDKFCSSCDFEQSRQQLIVPVSKISDENCSHIIFDEFFLALPDDRRKVLTFTDNVQRASKFAREIEETHLKSMARAELEKIIESLTGSLDIEEIISKAIKKLKIKTTVDEYLESSLKKELYEELFSTGNKVASLANRGLFELKIFDLESFQEQDHEKLSSLLSVFKKNNQFLGYYQIVNKEYVTSYNNFYDKSQLRDQIYRNINNLKGKRLDRKKIDYSEVDRFLTVLLQNGYLNEFEDKYFFKELCVEVHKTKNAGDTELNYYSEWARKDNIPFVKTRIDTGKTTPEERSDIEKDFKNNNLKVNFLVSTPTLELGIDIGNLDVVGLLYAPPSPAQYVQRIGRAGRSGQSSMALTYLSKRTLDSTYFYQPKDLVEGIINPPSFNVNLEIPVKKALFSLFFYYTLQYTDFRNREEGSSWNQVYHWEKNFSSIKKCWFGYEADFNKYLTQYLSLSQIKIDTTNLLEEWCDKLAEYIALQKELLKDRSYREKRRISIYNYFQEAGLLPDYAFGSSGAMVLVSGMSPIKGFGLREVCPPSTLDYNKSRFSCQRIDNRPNWIKTIATTFKQCPRCNEVIDINSKRKVCPFCEMPLNVSTKEIIEPKIIKARRSTFSLTQKRVNWSYHIIDVPEEIPFNNNIVSEPFTCDIGMLFDSVIVDGNKENYNLCVYCGEIYPQNVKSSNFCEKHKISDQRIGTKFKTRAIIVDYSDIEVEDPLTLLNAFIAAITLEAGCEDGEIGGMFLDESSKLIIFDDVEGGVGFVDILESNFGSVLEKARKLCMQDCCEDGCIRCIGSFWRQKDLEYLRKKDIIPVIDLMSQNV